jgi:isoquinoline 1-oxidoreductase subunit alpha
LREREDSVTTLKFNGEDKSFDAPDNMPLLWVLRDVLGMTGTKYGCGIAQCGARTVHVEGKPVRSCLLQVGATGGRAVTTIEGVGRPPVGTRVQTCSAWYQHHLRAPNRKDSAIDAAMAGNICRYGTYLRVRQAIQSAARDGRT